jgi:hypothetical protein
MGAFSGDSLSTEHSCISALITRFTLGAFLISPFGDSLGTAFNRFIMVFTDADATRIFIFIITLRHLDYVLARINEETFFEIEFRDAVGKVASRPVRTRDIFRDRETETSPGLFLTNDNGIFQNLVRRPTDVSRNFFRFDILSQSINMTFPGFFLMHEEANLLCIIVSTLVLIFRFRYFSHILTRLIITTVLRELTDRMYVTTVLVMRTGYIFQHRNTRTCLTIGLGRGIVKRLRFIIRDLDNIFGLKGRRGTHIVVGGHI